MSEKTADATEDPVELKKQRIAQIIESESKSSLKLRRWIVLSVIALYVFIGIPLWFKLTDIYRAPLPSNFINFLQTNQNIDLKIHNEVYVRVTDKLYFPDLPEAVQIQVNHELNKLNEDPNERLVVDWNVTLKVLEEDHQLTEDDYVLVLELGEGEGISVDETRRETVLFYTLQSVKNNDLPFFVTQTLLYHIFNSEIELLKVKNQNRSINSLIYSPKVHLSFKLLTGDGNPIDWEIAEALELFFEPVQDLLKNFVEFTIDSEIIYHASLNKPKSLDIINISDLSTVLDFSEWGISSNEFSYPTLNFILYYPSNDSSPLTFGFDQTKNAFLIPQWGSVILQANSLSPNTILTQKALLPILETFTSELFTLLGLPRHPKTPSIRLDALTKYTIVNNLKRGIDSLSSLLKLSKSLSNISIPKTVQDNVRKALEAREKVTESLNENKDFRKALKYSNQVLKFSEDAFFDREMVQQTFFPQEHKVAVYLPLLGPLTLMTVLWGFRVLTEIKLYKKKRD